MGVKLYLIVILISISLTISDIDIFSCDYCHSYIFFGVM